MASQSNEEDGQGSLIQKVVRENERLTTTLARATEALGIFQNLIAEQHTLIGDLRKEISDLKASNVTLSPEMLEGDESSFRQRLLASERQKKKAISELHAFKTELSSKIDNIVTTLDAASSSTSQSQAISPSQANLWIGSPDSQDTFSSSLPVSTANDPKSVVPQLKPSTLKSPSSTFGNVHPLSIPPLPSRSTPQKSLPPNPSHTQKHAAKDQTGTPEPSRIASQSDSPNLQTNNDVPQKSLPPNPSPSKIHAPQDQIRTPLNLEKSPIASQSVSTDLPTDNIHPQPTPNIPSSLFPPTETSIPSSIKDRESPPPTKDDLSEKRGVLEKEGAKVVNGVHHYANLSKKSIEQHSDDEQPSDHSDLLNVDVDDLLESDDEKIDIKLPLKSLNLNSIKDNNAEIQSPEGLKDDSNSSRVDHSGVSSSGGSYYDSGSSYYESDGGSVESGDELPEPKLQLPLRPTRPMVLKPLALGKLAPLKMHHDAVDRSKFKTCDQNAFCKRNRQIESGRTSLFEVIKGSAKIENRHILLDIIDGGSKVQFIVDISLYRDNTIRFRVKEKNPLHPRYEPNELIHENSLSILRPIITEQNDGGILISYDVPSPNEIEEWGSVSIKSKPFALEVLDSSGSPLIVLNEQGLFNFEHHREKSEPKPDQPSDDPNATVTENVVEEPNLWEEKFSSHTDHKRRGPASVSMDVSFIGASHVYGLPEHASALALTNTRGEGVEGNTEPYRLFNLDVFEYEINNNMALYGGIPIVFAQSKQRTVAAFWNSVSETYVDISASSKGWTTEAKRQAHFFSETGNIDLFLLLGPRPKNVFKQYTRLTGPQALPPLFSLGYHQCRWNYKDEEDVSGVDSKFDEHDIPYDVLWLDIEHTDGKRYFTWDVHNFPQPAEMQKKIAAKGRKMVTIVDPHIKSDSGYQVYSEAEGRDLFVKDKDGKQYKGWCWPGQSSWIDFMNPAGVDYWKERFQFDKYPHSTETLHTWNDMNEPSVFDGPEVTMHKDCLHHGDLEHREIHNLYGTLVHMATFQGLKDRAGGNERPFVLSRAFSQGSQKWGAVWTGDNKADWEHLAIAQPMLLSLGISGIAFAGTDVGGFFGDCQPELLVRWYQAAAFHPFFRAHGHLDTKRREPWLFGDENLKIIKSAISTRYALLPYLYTTFKHAEETGMPVMRPLWSEFPEDESTFSQQDEFLVGGSVLVRPITSEHQTDNAVYFPGNEPWYDIENFKKYEPAQTHTIFTPLSQISAYYRGGSIIPRKERLRRSSTQMVNDPYTLIVALDTHHQAAGELFIDDGKSFLYQKGAFVRRKFIFKDNTLQSTDSKTASQEYTETFTTSCKIERILVLGYAKPKSIILNRSGPVAPKSLVFGEVGGTVMIRKPDVSVTEDWSIVFEL